MSPLDVDSMAEKKAKLRQATKNLEILKKQKSAVKKDEILQGSVLYYLLLGIECILDIGNHILSEEFGRSASAYERIIPLLVENGVVTKKLGEEAEGMGGFRNKIIHDYTAVNTEKVIDYLEVAPEQFNAFGKAFSDFINQRSLKK